MKSLQKIKFGDLYLIPSRNGLSRPERVRGSGFKMINMGEIFQYDRIGDIPMELVPMSHREVVDMCVEERDLLFARQSLVLSGAGKVSIVTSVQDKTTFESHIIRVRLDKNKAEPLFYYYYFKSPYSGMRAIVQQCAQSGIRGSDLQKLLVSYPKLETQKGIADIIDQYDQLLDINRQRIQLLEEAARLLFREWFVYFRFPGHEKVNVVDGVPEGWKKEKINKLVTFKRGVEPGSDNYLETYESGSFHFFRVSDLVTRNPSIFVDEQYAKSALLEKSDIVISLDGSVGIVSMGLEGCYSTGIRKLIIKDRKINRAYLYFLMKSHYLQGVINAYAKGTTIQHAGEAIKHMNPILPPQNLMDLFNEIASPALNEILILLVRISAVSGHRSGNIRTA